MLDDSILTNIRNTFASAVQRIFIPSLGKTYSFREASVKEHKSLSKTIISNKDSQSVIYAATLAMIKNLCLEDDFNPYEMSEFDRLRVIVYLFSNNFFTKNLSIKCPRKSCGENIKFPIKYGTLLKMMDLVDCSDIVFSNKSAMGTVQVVSGFPSTKRYLSLLEAIDLSKEKSIHSKNAQSPMETTYVAMDNIFPEMDATAQTKGVMTSSDMEVIEKIRRRREILKGNIGKAVEEKRDVMGNVDLKSVGSESTILDVVDMYLKRIMVSDIPGSENELDIDFSSFGYDDTERILSVLPMGLFMSADGNENIIKSTTKALFEKLNACVPKIVCPKCGCEISKRLTLPNFFIFG